MSNLFTQHPHSLGESYWIHFKQASRFSGYMLLGGFACLIHGIFPFLFERTASNVLFKLIYDFVGRMPKVGNRMVLLRERIAEKIATDSLNEEMSR